MKPSDRTDRTDRTESPLLTASSVVTSLRALAQLEDERIAREREAVLETARAKKAAETMRHEQDATRKRREEDERVAVTSAAVERVRLEHQAARERDERARTRRAESEAESRRVASERLREAERVLASRPRSSLPGRIVRVAHVVATASLALGVVLCGVQLHDAQRAQAALARTAAADERALGDARAENTQLTRDHGVALAAARNARSTDAPTAPPLTNAPPPPIAPRHLGVAPPPPPPPPPVAARTGCDPRDPLCADLP